MNSQFHQFWRPLILLLTAALLSQACGDDPESPADAGTDAGDTGGTLADTDDATGDVAPGPDTAEERPPLPLGPLFEPCPETVAPGVCYVRQRDANSPLARLAHRIALKARDTQEPRNLRWDWGEAVLLTGIERVATLQRDATLHDLIQEYLDQHLSGRVTIQTSDTSAPTALSVAMIRAGRDDERYRTNIDNALEYYLEKAARTSTGGLSHFGTLGLFEPEMWIDSLYMFGNVMTPWGAWTQDTELLDFWQEQLGIFAGDLQEENGLFRHAAHSHFPQEPDIYWGRGNGWVLAAAAEHAAVRRDLDLPLSRSHHILHDLIEGILPWQDTDSGLWWSVLNRPGETELETSATALFAYGLARAWRYGLVGDEALEVIESALQGVLDRIRFDEFDRPVITGISGPTNAGRLQDYQVVPIEDDLPWGVGAVLLALTEASGLDLDLRIPDHHWEPLALPADPGTAPTPTAGFTARQAAFLQFCADNNGPGDWEEMDEPRTGPGHGGVYGQSCRVALDLPVNEAAIRDSIAHMEARLDVSDFHANALVRLLFLDDNTGALGEDMHLEIRQTLLDFRYWLDQPGQDQMAFWTENHQILFHTVEYLMGQREPDTVFSNAGMTGTEHKEHARDRIDRWLRLRGRWGFSEWHSPVYFNEDIPALLNLVDFADDAELRERAAIVLDILTIDLATNLFRGAFATTAGRIYSNRFIGGANDSTREFTVIALGQGEARNANNFGGAFLATSTWFPSAPIEALANQVANGAEHRQRDSWLISERDRAGVGTSGLDEVVVWAGLSAIVAPDIVDGALDVIDEYDLWDGFLFGTLPSAVTTLVRSLMGTPGLRKLAEDLLPLSEGMALEAVDTYLYRTADYQLAAAQDWKPGMWTSQTLMVRAALDQDVSITLNAPTSLGTAAPEGVTIDDPWIGGWLPRVTAFRNLAVVQFHKPAWAPVIESVIQGSGVHAYFPRSLADDWAQVGSWAFLRAGDSYAALWSQKPAAFSDDLEDELWVDSLDNVFILELGSATEDGSFDDFMRSFEDVEPEALPHTYGGMRVSYSSPSQGLVEVGWRGPLRVEGERVELGPYPRFDGPGVSQARGTTPLILEASEQRLILDVESRVRSVLGLDS